MLMLCYELSADFLRQFSPPPFFWVCLNLSSLFRYTDFLLVVISNVCARGSEKPNAGEFNAVVEFLACRKGEWVVDRCLHGVITLYLCLVPIYMLLSCFLDDTTAPIYYIPLPSNKAAPFHSTSFSNNLKCTKSQKRKLFCTIAILTKKKMQGCSIDLSFFTTKIRLFLKASILFFVL